MQLYFHDDPPIYFLMNAIVCAVDSRHLLPASGVKFHTDTVEFLATLSLATFLGIQWDCFKLHVKSNNLYCTFNFEIICITDVSR